MPPRASPSNRQRVPAECPVDAVHPDDHARPPLPTPTAIIAANRSGYLLAGKLDLKLPT